MMARSSNRAYVSVEGEAERLTGSAELSTAVAPPVATTSGRFGQQASAGSGQITLSSTPTCSNTYTTGYVNSLVQPQQMDRGKGIILCLVFS